jgi:hypothetical protein
MKITTLNTFLVGLVGGLLVVIGVLSLHLLPKPGVGTPPTLEPTAAASTPASSENTCSYENMPEAPVLPASITIPRAGTSVWKYNGKLYVCLLHLESYRHTGCPVADIVTQGSDGNFVSYSAAYNHSTVLVVHVPFRMASEHGIYYAINHSPREHSNISDIPKGARSLLYLLTEGYPLGKTSCNIMK